MTEIRADFQVPEKLPERLRGAVREGTARGLRLAALLVFRETKLQLTAGAPPGQSHPSKLSARTGALRNSLKADDRASEDADGQFIRVGYREGPASRYAPVHEADQPTVITPKRARVLSIPIGEALTPAGVPRFQSPRQVEGHWRTSKKGSLLFFPDDGGAPLFLGLKRTTIKNRRPLKSTAERTQDSQLRLIQQELARALRQAQGAP